MTKLPEPAFTPDYGLPPVKYYTSEQMLQFRRDALEEAAQWIKSYDGYTDSLREEAIRKLKDET
jgi:hypothetical protein